MERHVGIISDLVPLKGFGFISVGTNSKDFEKFFFHFRQFKGDEGLRLVRQKVSFDVLDYREGRSRTALNVEPVE